MTWIDVKLGLRMLVKYPGLTLSGGLALAIAIGIGAGWYEVSREVLRPSIPLPDGDRSVEIEMRDTRAGGDEGRLLHDFLIWRRDLRAVEDLSAYRTLERPLSINRSTPERVTVAEISSSAFRFVRVRPLVGRPLIEADEQPGAPRVVVLGHEVWQRRFGGRPDAVGQRVMLGDSEHTIVGVMPAGFAFPINHRLWVPLPLRPSGYAPLEGPPVRIVGRLARGVTQARANVEVATLTERVAGASPQTHARLRPRVLAYGGESPGDRGRLEFVVRHGPVLLVLLAACMNVGMLIYARTATREGEIALRYGLGASRGRIVGQLFVEALVLATVAAMLGLSAAHAVVTWGVQAYYSSTSGGAPFWIDPGLTFSTVLYATGLAIAGAAILGVLPAIKATGSSVQARLRDLAAGSTLRFGAVWTTALIAQVALTVICIAPAAGISEETLRDRRIRSRFPGHQYLAVRMTFDQDLAGGESDAAFAERRDSMYAELERRLRREHGVVAVTFADRLPGMSPEVRRAEFEASEGAPPTAVPDLWINTVAPTFFDTFERPIVAGRGFSRIDFATGARNVIVNEAFARHYMNGGSPVGRRLRYATADAAVPEPWLEIVGVVRDIGMTPTDTYDGEAPYLFHASQPGRLSPTVMAVKAHGDPAAFAPRVRELSWELDASLRLDEMRRLDDWIWRVDLPGLIAAGAVVAVVGLGLLMSAAAIFSLMSVTVARRTREIGLRAALGASTSRLLVGIFARVALLVGSGIVAGNLVILLIVMLDGDVTLSFVAGHVLRTSAVMLTVGLLACVQPARRALTIDPAAALRDL